MYIIYTAQLGDNLHPGCRITEPADDVCLFSSVASLEAVIRITEEGLNKVEETLQTLGVDITSEKQTHGLQPEQSRILQKSKGKDEKGP
jgi:hypothetical protein